LKSTPQTISLTTKKTTAPRKKSKQGFDLKPYLIGIGLLVLVLTCYTGFRIYNADRRLIPLSVLTLIAGVFFESKRLSDKWQIVMLKALGSFIFSFIVFLPFKREYPYSFENHIQAWPYMFTLLFIIFSIAFHGEKVIPKLTEGITLLQSVAVVYWVLDYGFIDTSSLFLRSLMVVGLIFALFSAFHAFTHTELSRTNRLTLSIWSSVIMLLFASDNIYRVYQNEQIESTADLTHGLYVGLQYFLLGVSAIYIVQNFLMLLEFLPNKNKFFNAQYYREVKQLKSTHIKRYSAMQVSVAHAFFCLLFSGTIFALNYHYQVLPRHVAIWSVFVLFPIILSIYDHVTQTRTSRTSAPHREY